MFSWNKIPKYDSSKLLDYLIKKFGVDWVKTATITKTKDDKSIMITDGKNVISLNLNKKNTELNLIINNDKTETFTVKGKKGKLNIYTHGIGFFLKRGIGFFLVMLSISGFLWLLISIPIIFFSDAFCIIFDYPPQITLNDEQKNFAGEAALNSSRNDGLCSDNCEVSVASFGYINTVGHGICRISVGVPFFDISNIIRHINTVGGGQKVAKVTITQGENIVLLEIDLNTGAVMDKFQTTKAEQDRYNGTAWIQN